jgi:hypothetical protein
VVHWNTFLQTFHTVWSTTHSLHFVLYWPCIDMLQWRWSKTLNATTLMATPRRRRGAKIKINTSINKIIIEVYHLKKWSPHSISMKILYILSRLIKYNIIRVPSLKNTGLKHNSKTWRTDCTECRNNHLWVPSYIWNMKMKIRIILQLHLPLNLTPELNPSVQRCLTRFFTGDFASWTLHFFNICVKSQQMQQLFIQIINYIFHRLFLNWASLIRQ